MTGPYATAVQSYRSLGWQGTLPVGLVVNNGSSGWHPQRKSAVPAGYTGHDGGWPDERGHRPMAQARRSVQHRPSCP